jgi:uncharacterized protein (DUF2252 family)
MKSVASRILEFNKNRIPELVSTKFKNMQGSIFKFYRGSCHLFYEDLKGNEKDLKSPLSWVCGDLHLENFGSYKADNRQVYFDINDFDESIKAPCLYDISRLLVSIIVGADSINTNRSSTIQLCKSFIKIYSETLVRGHSRLVQEETSSGIVKDLFKELLMRKRKDFINQRTILDKRKRKLLIDRKHVGTIEDGKKNEIIKAINIWASNQIDPSFYKILDIGYRIAGTGSLGLERYVLLVEGKGSPDKNYLLDLKVACKSSLMLLVKDTQPKWRNEAERIIEIQKRMQAFPLALLGSIKIQDQWFVLKELQPTQDKVNLTDCKGKFTKLENYIRSIAEITAWAQLRSGGRQGSAIADEFIEFGQDIRWAKGLMKYVLDYSKQVKLEYKEYCEAYADGVFKNQ